MAEPGIRNVVFDIGNVVVRWDPALISARTVGEDRATPAFVQSVFGHALWLQLNRGEISEEDAKAAYMRSLGLARSDVDALFFHVKDSQSLVPGTVGLMDRLSRAGYRIFALSDNVREIVTHLRSRYDFWKYFHGVVISAELGVLKPSSDIYRHLLARFDLVPHETVFLDDLQKNVDGARAMNIRAFQFSDADRAERDLISLGLTF